METVMEMKTPSHPGKFLRIAVFEPLGLNVTDAAQALGVTRQALSTLLNKKSRLSPDMAMRFEKAFGVQMDTLMRMQSAYDIAEARANASKIKVKRYRSKIDRTRQSA